MRSIENGAVRVIGPMVPGAAEILREDALDLLATFVRLFGARRAALLRELVLGRPLGSFLTLPAYAMLAPH